MGGVFDVIVIGGGVIGATCAWRLAQTNRRVLLLERGQMGGEASSAAAGMLGAQLEVSEPGPFYHLCLESRRLYQDFVDELTDFTGIDPQLTHNGIYQLAYSKDEATRLQEKLRWQVQHGANAAWMDGESVSSEEPLLSASVGALLLPDDGNVNAPLLTRALGAAAKQSCTVMEGTQVTDIERAIGGGYLVKTCTAAYRGEVVVIAAGAWADRLLSPFHIPCSIQPVKGQLLAIRPRHAHRLRHSVFNNHVYLVPKRDGTIVVGATEERGAGYNRDITMDAMMSLMSSVHRIAPGLHDAAFERSWMGLRPESKGGLPCLGEVPEYPGLHVAVGHFRNGILLSPVTGDLIVQSVARAPWPNQWRPFHVASLMENPAQEGMNQ